MRLPNLGLRDRFRVPILAGLVIVAVMVFIFVGLKFRKGAQDVNSPLARGSFSYNDAWVALDGEWTASSAEIENNSEERGAKLMSRLGNWGDYQVQADLKMASPYGGAGLIIRSSGEEEGVDSYHGYFAGINPAESSLEFGRADFGWHPLFHKPLPPTKDSDLGWVH